MHFVTGGSFNGKSKWVKESYKLGENHNYEWYCAYEEDFDEGILQSSSQFIVISGMEFYIKKQLKFLQNEEACLVYFKKLIDKIVELETDASQKFIIIGSDITRGVVPLEKENRQWRDITGLTYQYIVEKAERVEQLFYGLACKIK